MADLSALQQKLKMLQAKLAAYKNGEKNANYIEGDGNQRQEETIIRIERGIIEVNQAIAAEMKKEAKPAKENK